MYGGAEPRVGVRAHAHSTHAGTSSASIDRPLAQYIAASIDQRELHDTTTHKHSQVIHVSSPPIFHGRRQRLRCEGAPASGQLPEVAVGTEPPRPLSKNESIKKKTTKGSRRAWLCTGTGFSAVLHELKLVPRAREKKSRLIHLTGGDGGGTAMGAVASTSLECGPGASHLRRGTRATVGDDPSRRPNGIRSSTVALACVVALGKVSAICCCTCVAWWCGGGSVEEHSVGVYGLGLYIILINSRKISMAHSCWVKSEKLTIILLV